MLNSPRILLGLYNAGDKSAIGYFQRGYTNALRETGRPYRVWDGQSALKLWWILLRLRPTHFIGFLRGSFPYKTQLWAEGPMRSRLQRYRQRNGLRTALFTHPNVETIKKVISEKLLFEDGDASNALHFYNQFPPPLKAEAELLDDRFIDLILHLFSASRADAFEYWRASGIPVLPMPLAADTTIYQPSEAVEKDISISFIGGWWPFKGLQLDRFLKPMIEVFGDQLKIYGRNWPYHGAIPVSDLEYRSIIARSRICLNFHEPSQVQGIPLHVNERIFKLFAMSATVVSDNNSCIREYFSPSEAIVCNSPEEMISTCQRLLANPEECSEWAEKGHYAVRRRHTYLHRIEQILQALDPSTFP